MEQEKFRKRVNKVKQKGVSEGYGCEKYEGRRAEEDGREQYGQLLKREMWRELGVVVVGKRRGSERVVGSEVERESERGDNGGIKEI